MRKTAIIILFSFLGIFSLYSCKKQDDKALLRSINDRIRGQYKCTNISFLGNPVDLDNDGEISNDIIKEFSIDDIARAFFKTPLRIEPALDYDDNVLIHMEIPIQYIEFDKKTKKYSPATYWKGFIISFMYSIGRDGLLTFSVYPENGSYGPQEDDDVIQGVDIPDTYGVGIRKINDDILEARVACMFYDFATSSIVKGEAIYRYERSSYSL